MPAPVLYQEQAGFCGALTALGPRKEQRTIRTKLGIIWGSRIGSWRETCPGRASEGRVCMTGGMHHFSTRCIYSGRGRVRQGRRRGAHYSGVVRNRVGAIHSPFCVLTPRYPFWLRVYTQYLLLALQKPQPINTKKHLTSIYVHAKQTNK